MTHYRTGLPAWGFAGWENVYFDSGDRLRQYASVFNCVEGNTTFYATPSEMTVAGWREQLDGLDFEFCFKLPREVTHEAGNLNRISDFLRALEPVHEFLGPFLVQLPAAVGPADSGWIKRLLAHLPDGFDAAVEVRHPAFFESPDRFDEVLGETGCLRAIMDARPIHLQGQSHPEVLAARHEKPDVPVFKRTANGGALVRVVMHPDDSLNGPYYDEWTTAVAQWLRDEERVWFMMHCPNNLHCPAQARRFHQALAAKVGIAPLPAWPVSQQSLF